MNNKCLKSVDELTSIKLLQIKPGKVCYGKILWLKIASKGFSTSSANFIVKDSEGTASMCCLYNMLSESSESLSTLNKAFPIGMKFGLKHPYLKIS